MPGQEAAELAIEREQYSSQGCVVVVRGQIDLCSAAAFRAALAQAVDDGMTELIVDLSGVEFIDSTGLGVLVGLSKRVRQLDGSISIVSPDETIRRVFELGGLTALVSPRRSTR